ncbi:MAG: hypothetical protein HQ556_12860 [Candidatus Marinimicrobia bacterium]|nr:hypothetical protein [Candidatus Neomarinimicrobiota bacterium]
MDGLFEVKFILVTFIRGGMAHFRESSDANMSTLIYYENLTSWGFLYRAATIINC